MAEKTAQDLMNFRLPEFKLSPYRRRILGERIIEVIRSRMFNAINVNDQEAKEYSPRGPIYMPLTWGTITRRAGGVVAKWPGRGQRELKGRYGIKRSDYLKYLGEQGYPVKLGVHINNTYRNLKTGKFENYSEFKQFIGHTGKRDLSLTGKMLADIAMVADSDTYVEIGFNSEEQQQKMAGNLKNDVQWGLSEADKTAIKETFDRLMSEELQESNP